MVNWLVEDFYTEQNKVDNFDIVLPWIYVKKYFGLILSLFLNLFRFFKNNKIPVYESSFVSQKDRDKYGQDE